jgi:asparagine synthase (glutamine-hydrolysing)
VKVRDGVEKWVLRQAVADLLPSSVVRRTKLPFTAPPLSLFGSALMEDTLRSRRLADVPFFDAKAVRVLLDRLPAMEEQDRRAFDPVLMLVLTACLAHERFGL